MAVTPSEIVTPITPKAGYLVVTKDAVTGALTALDGTLYPTQAETLVAINAADDDDVATTTYLILEAKVLSGRLATVT